MLRANFSSLALIKEEVLAPVIVEAKRKRETSADKSTAALADFAACLSTR